MTATNFTMDDITNEMSEEDYKPKRSEPRLETFYEFSVNNAKVEQHAVHGYLVIKAKANALDSHGNSMFTKYLNIALPLSVGEHVAPTWSKGLYLQQMRPLFPEIAPYDSKTKDEVTGKFVYHKGEETFDGSEYEKRVTDANRKLGAMTKDFAQLWLEHGNGVEVVDLDDKRFFAKCKLDNTGKYVNIDKMLISPPNDVEVCYDKKVALSDK